MVGQSYIWIWLTFFYLFILADPVYAEEQNTAATASGAPVPLFEGLGTYHRPITTKSELAQRYFNQGSRLVYGFNHNEAIRAFKEVIRLDPNCAMGYWGVALSLGPNINDPMPAERGKQAFEAIQQAITRARYAGDHERAYIEALATRYVSDPEKADRKERDKAYAEAMRGLHQRYPHDLDAATLFAASLMNVRPWDYWTPDSQPKDGTLELVAALESVLERIQIILGLFITTSMRLKPLHCRSARSPTRGG